MSVAFDGRAGATCGDQRCDERSVEDDERSMPISTSKIATSQLKGSR
jgi:hypothetical protein